MKAGEVHLLLLLVLTLQHSGLIQVQAICRCAEGFPSETELNQTSSYGLIDSNTGETRVFTSNSFHCKGNLRRIRYTASHADCDQSISNSSSGAGQEQYPEFQLWRKNGTALYQLVRSQSLTSLTGGELILDWSTEIGDIVGLWIPSRLMECQFVGQRVVRIGYLYGKSSVSYVLDGSRTEFSIFDYKLMRNSSQPMISVTTDMDLNFICLIGLPAGGALSIFCLCTVCCAIGYSIRREKRKKIEAEGELNITHTAPQSIDGEEDGHQMEVIHRSYSQPSRSYNIQETSLQQDQPPPLPPPNATWNRRSNQKLPPYITAPIQQQPVPMVAAPRTDTLPPYTNLPTHTAPTHTGGIQRSNRPPPLNIQQGQGAANPRVSPPYTGPLIPPEPSTPSPPPSPDLPPAQTGRVTSIHIEHNPQFEGELGEIDEAEDEYITTLSPINTSAYANVPSNEHSYANMPDDTMAGGYANMVEHRDSTLY